MDGEATAVARTPSSANLARAKSRGELPRRNSNPDLARRTVTRLAPAEEDERSEPRTRRSASATQVPRAPSRTQVPRRTGTGLALDRNADPGDEGAQDDGDASAREEEARNLARLRDPEPRRRSGEHRQRSAEEEPALEAAPPPPLDPAELARRRAQARARWKRLLTAVAGVSVLGTVGIFHAPLLAWLNETASSDAQGIYISVTSNQPVTVSVRHKEPNASEPVTVLGEQPLRHVSGAHIGDVVVLDNRKTGAHDEVAIPFGQPGETRVLTKEFHSGKFRPHFLPRNVAGLQLWMNDNLLALYPGPMPELVEGKHQIEVRAPELKAPVSFEVDVKANETVDMKPLDLGPYLD